MEKFVAKNRLVCLYVVIFLGWSLKLGAGGLDCGWVFSADRPSAEDSARDAWKCSNLCVRGVYPHLAALSTSYSEAGIGALVPWADRLWYVSYVAHIQGEGVGLYEILAGCHPKEGPTSSGVMSVPPQGEFSPPGSAGAAPLPVPLAIRRHPASLVGTHANRMIHLETQQLLIGPYVIDAKGQVRVIKPLAGERLTGTMRHLTDPARKVYYLAMEGGFYEVDLATLQARKLFELTKELGIPSRVHFKGGYTAQGRVVVANNSYFEEDQRQGYGLGRLAEWDGQRWTILRRTAFCDVTTAASIQPTPNDTSTLWANGWDRRSVLLCILHQGQWQTYRLPKASQSYDQAWCTEWPRIRPLSGDLMLLDMHGLYYKMSPDLRPGRMGGLVPYAVHLKMTPDFCLWQDRLVLAGDENSSMNHRHRTGGQPQSNLWLGTLADLGRWGPPSGWGGPWLEDPVQPNSPSEPFLVGGFDHRCLHIAADPMPQQSQSSPRHTPPAEPKPMLPRPSENLAFSDSRQSGSPESPHPPGEGKSLRNRPAERAIAPPDSWLPTSPPNPAKDPFSVSMASPGDSVLRAGSPLQKPIQVLLEVDPDGTGQWKPYLTLSVPPGGYTWHVVPRSLRAVWMRLRADQSARMSAQFHFLPGEPKAVEPELFAQLGWVAPAMAPSVEGGMGVADGGQVGAFSPQTVQINGALLPFADRLWFCAYRDRGPGQAAEPAGLYEITQSMQFIRRAESVPGIFSNRLMVGGVPGYLSIGPHLIGPDGTVRTIPGLAGEHLVASVRLEETAPTGQPKAKNASPAKRSKLGLLTAAGQLLEVDLASLAVENRRNLPAELAVADQPLRFQAAHTIGHTLIVAAVGNAHQPGLLAEQSGGKWQIIDQAHYAEVCNLGSMSEQVVAVGWDAASTILMLRTPTGWQKYRLPKAHENYPPPGVDYTPRIREVVTERLLLDAGGLFYEVSGLPYAWSIRPIATHSRRIADFCSWRGLLVLAGCQAGEMKSACSKAPKEKGTNTPAMRDDQPRTESNAVKPGLVEGAMSASSGSSAPWASSAETRGFLADTGASSAQTRASSAKTREPSGDTRSSSADTRSSSADTRSSSVDTRSSSGDTRSSSGDTRSSSAEIGPAQRGSVGSGSDSGPVFRAEDGVGLWFGTVDDLWLLGKIRGVGGPWLRTPVQPNLPSDPYLMCHFDRKRLELAHDAAEPVEFTVEVDFTVQRSRWYRLITLRVPPGQTVVYEFPEGYCAHWVRLKVDRACRATARFIYE